MTLSLNVEARAAEPAAEWAAGVARVAEWEAAGEWVGAVEQEAAGELEAVRLLAKVVDRALSHQEAARRLVPARLIAVP